MPEAHMLAALEAAGLGVWSWDLHDGRVSLTPPLERLLGLAPGAFAGGIDALVAFVHEEDRGGLATQLTLAVASGADHRAELRLVRADGAQRRVATIVRTLRDDAGDPTAVAGIVEELGAGAARAQPEGRSPEQRLLEAVLRHMPAGLIVVEAATGRVQVVNERFNALSGGGVAPGDSLFERMIGAVFEPDGTPRRIEAHPLARSLVRGEAVQDVETLFERPDGRRVVVSVSSAPLREGTGGIDAAIAIYVDVTERARLRDELADQRARLAAVLDAIPSGVMIAEAPAGTVSFANEGAVRLLRGRPTVIDDPNVYRKHRCWTGDGAPLDHRELPLLRALVRGEVVTGVDITFEVNGGEIIDLRCNAAPVRNTAGRVAAAVCIFEDVTSEVLAKRQREQTERFRELFVGMLGHDLKNPLAAILAASGLLLRRGALAAEDARAAERIGAAGLRMKRMIEQILDLTRGRLGGGIPVVPRPTNVRELVRRIVEELEAAHLGRTVRLSVRGDPACRCDPDRLGQAVSNLVGNALEHTDPSAAVDVLVEPAEGNVVIAVHNDGPPIPPDVLEVIFDPFRRSPSRREHESGLGLGLYITQQIALAHGGRIDVHSNGEAGTTFTLRLPVTGPPAGPG